jgi:malonyl-CoA/methylmalonyl-CoA synthetase
VHEAFEARTGHRVLERYGMSETMMLTSNPLHGERRPGSVGFPLPGVEVRVTGGDPGSVEVRGPNVFGGYWRRPDLVEEFTDDGWFVTGDLGTFDDDGYLQLVGRSKDLVISGGLNVYPAEVEAVLDRIEGVAESAVVGVPHDDLGEAVVAVVVPVAGASLDPEVVRSAARAALAGFKVPKVVHLVDELPRNAMGKVEKAVLRRTLTAQPAPKR